MTICYPSETDWGCAYSPTEISEMREDAAKAEAMERSEALAWYTLAALTGYQIGVCPTLIRPCAARCAPFGSYMAAPVGGGGGTSALPLRTIGSFTPHIVGGQWVNSCGCGSSGCGCGRVDEVLLPGPVGSIEYVKIDGEIISPTRYRVDEGSRLVSTDSTLRWPVAQDISAGPDDEGAFAVSYYQGAAPDDMTRYAAGLLAVEFYKACTGGKCKLPAGVTTLVRDGVTFEVETGLFQNGFTGIIAVDAVIRIYNPNGLKTPPMVTSPDAASRGRRQTWGNW